MILTTRPIDVWPRPETKYRERSPFSASYTSTLQLLDRELGMLRAKNIVLQIDVEERDLRLDGELRANARPQKPRVVLVFDSMHGPLKYYCDRWSDWQGNLRGIALGLEAQRRLERYGITSRGEQYTGWKALGSGIELGPASMSPEQAADYIARQSGVPADGGDIWVEHESFDPLMLEHLYRLAAKRLHPDASGGDVADFQRLTEAKRVLDETMF